MTLIVNIFGGSGSGKSTLAAALFAQLKYRGLCPELASEWIKEAAWEGRDHIVTNQVYIFAKQLKRIFDLLGKADVAICDSPILLSLVYGGGKNPELDSLVLAEHRKMDTINVFLHREKPYEQRGRWQTEEETKAIDQQVLDMLNKHSIEYIVLPGNELTPGVLAKLVEQRLDDRFNNG